MTLQETILLGLKRAQGMPLDQAAGEIARYIEIANELSGSAQSTPKPAMPSGLIIKAGTLPHAYPEPEMREPMAAPRRIITGSRPKPVDFEYRTVAEIAEYLEKVAPPTMDVMIHGATQPLTLTRKIEPMDTFGLVRLRYRNPASDIDDAPTVVFKSTDEHLNLAERLEEIKAAARTQLTAHQRKIEPRIAPAIPFNPMNGAGGFGGGDSSDDGQGGSAIAAEWAANRSPEQEKFMRG